MKTFLNDKDGFSLQDLEKITLNFLFALSVVVILYKFSRLGLSDIIMVQFSLGIGGLLVARKVGSYFKKDSYNQQNQLQPRPIQNEFEQEQAIQIKDNNINPNKY